mmetsp:Transcript_23541/g.41644  ORF Transcript_23541/g.41644 Transcript_23541/m.41644 type:complete len:236 (+) Transcript_23541:495-1202(+)
MRARPPHAHHLRREVVLRVHEAVRRLPEVPDAHAAVGACAGQEVRVCVGPGHAVDRGQVRGDADDRTAARRPQVPDLDVPVGAGGREPPAHQRVPRDVRDPAVVRLGHLPYGRLVEVVELARVEDLEAARLPGDEERRAAGDVPRAREQRVGRPVGGEDRRVGPRQVPEGEQSAGHAQSRLGLSRVDLALGNLRGHAPLAVVRDLDLAFEDLGVGFADARVDAADAVGVHYGRFE